MQNSIFVTETGMIRIRWWPLAIPAGFVAAWIGVNILMFVAAVGCNNGCSAPPWFGETWVSFPLRVLVGV